MKDAKRHRLVLIATILGSTVALLDGTIVNLALPKIAADLQTGFSVMQWITDGYLLTLSALILLGGSMGDIFGRKKIYLIGLIGFGVCSLLCAVSPTASFLVAARLLEGAFAAFLVPGALSIIQTNFPTAKRGWAIGQWTAWLSIGTILGPLMGGLILSVASWRWIFLINLPIIAACYLLAQPSIKETHDREPRRLDITGAALAALSLGAITTGLIEGPVQHWTTWTVLLCIAGLVLAAAFVTFERRQPDPMVPMSLFRSRNFSGSNLMTFGMYGALGGFIFALIIYLQTQLHYSSLAAGFSLLPISIIMFLFAGRVGGLSADYGARDFMTFGPILAGLGIATYYFLKPGDSYYMGVLPGVLLLGLGLVLVVAPLTTTVMASVRDHDSGIASGINNAVSRAAGLIVVALLGLLGNAQFFHFSIALCAILAIASGVTSWLTIDRTSTPS